jgi:DNA-binding response OmpR family regulator
MDVNFEWATESEVSPNAEGLAVSARQRTRILYVEDHSDTCEMVSLILSRSGYELVTAGTCNEALRLAKSSRFDMYILDNTLPDGSGFDLCGQLKALNSDASVLLCSGWSEDRYLDLAVESGAKGYLTKPFTPEELLREVTRLCTTPE